MSTKFPPPGCWRMQRLRSSGYRTQPLRWPSIDDGILICACPCFPSFSCPLFRRRLLNIFVPFRKHFSSVKVLPSCLFTVCRIGHAKIRSFTSLLLVFFAICNLVLEKIVWFAV